MKLFKLTALILSGALTLLFAACDPDNDGWHPDDNGSKVQLPASRMYILNEGSYELNNSGIAFYAPDRDADFISDIFMLQNGMHLGDTGYDMLRSGESVYVAVYGSNYLARLNSACVEQARVSFASDPDLQGKVRHLATDGSYIYASFYGGVVAKINSRTLKIEAKLQTSGANLEGVAVVDGKLYAANSYEQGYDAETGYNTYTYFTNLIVVDLRTFTETGSVTVAANPNSLAVESGKLFLISFGNYYDQGYSFQMIDPKQNNKVTELGVASRMAAGNGKVYLINSVTDWNTWATTNTFSYYDIAAARMHSESFMKNAPEALGSASIDMMAVDGQSGDIYLGVTHYNLSNGEMYRFKPDGTFVEMFDCGGQNPRAAVFF